MNAVNATHPRAKIQALIHEARRFYDQFANALTPEARNDDGTYIPYSGWSAKIVFGHVTFWNRVRIQRMEDAQQGRPITKYDDEEATNLAAYEACVAWSWDEIWAETLGTLDHAISVMGNFSDAELAETASFEQLLLPLHGSFIEHATAHFADYWHFHGQDERALALLATSVDSAEQLVGAEGRTAAVYNMACYHARKGAPFTQVESLLRESLATDMELRAWARQDADLVAYRDDPQFIAMTEVTPA